MADPDMRQLVRELDPDPRKPRRVLADATPNAEETARLLAQLEARRRAEVETLARRLAKDAEFARAVFAELARLDPGRFGALATL